MNKEEFLNGFEFVEAIATDFDQYHIFHNPEARLFAFGRVGSPDLFQLGYSINEDLGLVEDVGVYLDGKFLTSCTDEEAEAVRECYSYSFDHLLRMYGEVILNWPMYKMLIHDPEAMEKYYDWKIVPIEGNNYYIQWKGFSENPNVEEYIWHKNRYVSVLLKNRNHFIITHEDDETDKILGIVEWFTKGSDNSVQLFTEVYDPTFFNGTFDAIVKDLIYYLLYDLEYSYVVSCDQNILKNEDFDAEDYNIIRYTSEHDGILFRKCD